MIKTKILCDNISIVNMQQQYFYFGSSLKTYINAIITFVAHTVGYQSQIIICYLISRPCVNLKGFCVIRYPWLHLKFQEVEQQCDSVIYYDVYYQFNNKTIFISEEVVYLNFRTFRNVFWLNSGPNQITHKHRNRCILAVLMLYVIKFFMHAIHALWHLLQILPHHMVHLSRLHYLSQFPMKKTFWKIRSELAVSGIIFILDITTNMYYLEKLYW